jgi:hypothetical protein
MNAPLPSNISGPRRCSEMYLPGEGALEDSLWQQLKQPRRLAVICRFFPRQAGNFSRRPGVSRWKGLARVSRAQAEGDYPHSRDPRHVST